MCGGNITRPPPTFSIRGLSPRVRGKRHKAYRRSRSSRSIPACAGETRTAPRTLDPESVYPRVCGGNRLAQRTRKSVEGLSPRVRGKPIRQMQRCKFLGSIPACAGETADELHRGRVRRVYPRVCGGNASGKRGPKPSIGLSPRVRGKPGVAPAVRIAAGSIPACAGETAGVSTVADRGRVYPRVCGGNRIGQAFAATRRGLSPRVRGKPYHVHLQRLR